MSVIPGKMMWQFEQILKLGVDKKRKLVFLTHTYNRKKIQKHLHAGTVITCSLTITPTPE